jgi:penicillin G amidase
MPKLLKKSFKWLAIVSTVLLIIIAAAAWWLIRAPQAASSGVLTVSNLKQDLSITRNAQGVPHIQATNVNDAYFGLGFVHAQDRLWQMMFHRRVSQGRLSEVLGEATLDTDKFIRTLGVAQRAKQAIVEMKATDPVALARMQAYADGVNAYLSTRKGPLPIEFTLTGTPAPESWQVEDSAAWTIMMGWDLGGNWRRELRRLAYAKTWSVDKIDDLVRVNEGEVAPQTTDYAALYQQLGIYSAVNSLAQAVPNIIAAAPESGIDGIGSNNWVLAGSRTVSGKPLLANDPHLSMNTPSLWYLASLSATQGDNDKNAWHAVGATIPAMASVVLGRNAHIAWGFTNTAPDVQDTYIERINPQNPAEYQTPTGWAAFDVRNETIKIKGKADIKLAVRSTRHGAVISDVVKSGTMPPLKDTLAAPYVLALQWTALMPGDSSAAAGVQLSHAKSWDEFLAAAKGFHAPQQNIVFADVQGNIGYIAPARVPVRKADNDLKGLAPALGWEAKYDWDGWIPFDQLPRKFNPPEGYIATANEKINAAGDPFLTSEWALPYRAQRINALLNATPKHSLTSTTAIQTDITSVGMQQFLKAALPLLNDKAHQEWVSKLRNFDSVMHADSATPLLATALWRHLSKRLFEDDLGEKAYLEAADPSMVWLPMLAALEGKSKTDWCDDIRTAKKESCAEQVNGALADAIADLTARYGDASKWQWGRAHALQADHNPLGKVAPLTRFFSSSIPLGGDSFTVVQLKNQFGREATPYRATHGPGYRGIFDMSQPIAHVMQTTGQSGSLGSEHYKDFLKPWSKGETVAVPVGASNTGNTDSQRWVLKAARK